MRHDDNDRFIDHDKKDSKKLNKNDLRFGYFKN